MSKMDSNLVGVLFPGVVKNDEKAIECLGGIRNVSNVYSKPNKKRLGLSYQPDNPYVKKTFADSNKVAGLVLKVRVKKSKVDNEVKREVVSTEVVGRVKRMYKFESMCDFQFLPVNGMLNAQPKCIMEQIKPSGVENLNFMSEPAPYFIAPANFTRTDKPFSYSYTEKRYTRDSPEKDEEVHRRIRSERCTPNIRIKFNLVDALPTEPHEHYIKLKSMRLTVYPQLEDEFQTVKKLFDEKPIWSQNMLKYETKIRNSSLKIILPCLAVFFINGPWRMLWSRLGYDPRKDPKARFYQTLDFRLRHQAGVNSMVMSRGELKSYKKSDRVWHSRKDASDESTLDEVNEGAVLFRPGMAPTQRQIMYQYCDVKLPEVEKILCEEPPPGYLCHQKRGWLPPNTDQVSRDHIFRYTKETLLATHSTDLKLEQESSVDESSSEEEGPNTSANEAETSNT